MLNGLKLFCYDILGVFGGYASRHVEGALPGPLPEGYLEDQRHAAVSGIPYGMGDISGNGCGILAAFNVLRYFGIRAELTELVEWFEKNGEALFGKAGVLPKSLAAFFRKQGLSCEMRYAPGGQELPYQAGDPGAAFVLLFHPKKDPLHMHYVAILRERGLYDIKNAQYPYRKAADLSDCIRSLNGGNLIPLLLYRIEKPAHCFSDLPERHGGGRCHIQGIHSPSHGDHKDIIAKLQGFFLQSIAFAAEQNRKLFPRSRPEFL